MSFTASNTLHRRDWLRLAGSAAGMGALGIAGTLLGPRAARAADYKALVCISLVGGNDGFNMLVPTDTERHTQYLAARGMLGIPKASLLPLAGSEFGLHPSMAALLPAWTAGHLAPVVNVGPLAAPLTKAEYVAAGPDSPLIPDSLFSHSDQQHAWESAGAKSLARSGWGARAAEVLGTTQPVITLGGNSRFGTGDKGFELALPGPGGVFAAKGLTPDQMGWQANRVRKDAVDALYAPGQASTLGETFAAMQRDAFAMSDRLAALVAGLPGDPGIPAGIDRAFAPWIRGKQLTTPLAAQLYQIAKLIAGREQVQGDRHLYFASVRSFDTHIDQLTGKDGARGLHADLLAQVGDAMAAFHDAMQNLGLGQQVTAFTQSDFGRTFAPNSSRGSDHAWGNIQLVSGGAVKGGSTYGAYPTPVLGGPDDVGVEAWEMQGRWIPTASVDQYAATLLGWFGASGAQLDAILPGLAAFGNARSLGFMG